MEGKNIRLFVTYLLKDRLQRKEDGVLDLLSKQCFLTRDLSKKMSSFRMKSSIVVCNNEMITRKKLKKGKKGTKTKYYEAQVKTHRSRIQTLNSPNNLNDFIKDG